MSDILTELAFIEQLWQEIQSTTATIDPAAYKRMVMLIGTRKGTLQFALEEHAATAPADSDMLDPLTQAERDAHELRMNDLRYGNAEATWGPGAFFTPGPRGEMMVTVP